MRRWTVLLVVLWMPAWAADVASDQGFELGVMSFNVRYGTASDGPNNWENRKDSLVATIRDEDPDVVGTQECLLFQAEYIATELPHLKWFGVGREADGSGEQMAVFYRASLLEPVESGHYWLSETPDVPGSMSWNTACTRMVTWAKFRHVPTDRVVWFLNTHLDHRSQDARRFGAELIARRVASMEPHEPVVLTGDFNCSAGSSDPWRTLTQAELRDCWMEAADREGPETTWCGFAEPNQERGRRIDWVLVRGPIEVERALVLTQQIDGRYPSDHFPVMARLRVISP